MNILNKKFKYTNAAATDIRKTFAKARKAIEARKLAEEQAAKSVTPIRRKV